MTGFDVAIAGSGFGGTILARTLAAQGRRVLLVEKTRHPRFALGESSTPLAASSLERLAAAYDLPDLHDFAAYGRWRRHHDDLPRGLKRGFSFLRHTPGSSAQPRSLLVAASPDDAVADSHWLRADFDAFQVERAVAEGVDYRPQTEIEGLTETEHGIALALRVGESVERVDARLLVDATGAARLVERLLDLPAGQPLDTRSSLLYGHFRGVEPPDAGVRSPPYPPQWAAVHHLIDEGWIYELRFDDGLVSAGALLREPPATAPERAWVDLLARYPLLDRAFGAAQADRPPRLMPSLQHRMARAAGRNWAALPHTFAFVDPLFSTGIAWTLLAVERLAELLGDGSESEGFSRYAALVERESRQIDDLVAGAYDAMNDFDRFTAHSMAYFATVSWNESRQRLCRPAGAAWEGFLGVGDDRLESLFAEARGRLEHGSAADFESWIYARIADRDVAGLDRYGPTRVVPVDLSLLTERAPLLGLTPETVRPLLGRLRGDV